jgi:uncharacterized NAD-dependent epimerase/dehydratase family protein
MHKNERAECQWPAPAEKEEMFIMRLTQPYLLFLGDVTERPYAKTAFGLRDWAPDLCVGEVALPAASVSAGLPVLTPAAAFERGARALVIGVAVRGGRIQAHWMPLMVEALHAGLDIISGMHSRLSDYPELKQAAERFGRRLFDVREPPKDLPVGTGRKRSGKRLLTVGTDCSLGKKYTALSLTRALHQLKVDATFRATGQTGIMIAGEGIPIDAVVADFIGGAAETLSPDAEATHWDVVEGQGSIFHPSYSGVSLGLLHGTQPDVIVVCHEVGRDRIYGLEQFPTPTLQETIDLHLTFAQRTNPRARCAGISLNTSSLSDQQAHEMLRSYAGIFGLPVADPLRPGPEFMALTAACLS